MGPHSCTWEQLSTHDNRDDCWVAVDGKVYDITRWIPNHPGGADVLTLAAGRDITHMFESYHPFAAEKTTATLKKYYVCNISDSELPRYTTKSAMYTTMRNKVGEYFKKSNIDHKGSSQMYLRIAFIYFLFFASYYLAHFIKLNSVLLTLITAIAFGVCQALFSIHVLHDASHCEIGHNPLAWKLIGVTFDFLCGGSFFAWLHQHTLGHHLYTNVRGADPDLGEGDVDFRRVAPSQTWRPIYKYQHFYAPLLYGLLTIKARIQDSDTFISRLNGRVRVHTPSTFFVVTYLMGKMSFIFLRLVLPLTVLSLGRVMILFFIIELVTGYYLALVFQVSHVATDLTLLATPLPPAPAAKIDHDWAVMQLSTTQDFSHGDKLATFMTGALNYQVVHHLFPTVSQTYYIQIAPIIMETCKEYGVKYHVLPNFFSAFWSHIEHLRVMGMNPDSEDNGKLKSS